MSRILHLSMLYPPHIVGGAEKSVALLAEAQANNGDVVAASCTTPGPLVKEERRGVTVYRLPHETDFWGEEWPDHSLIERGIRRLKLPYNRKLADHFARVIEEFKPDIVHTHSLVDISTLVWEVAKARGVPIVHTLRDYDLLCANSSMFHSGRRCEQRHLKCKFFTHAKHAHHLSVDAVVGVGAEILQTHLDYGFFSHVPAERRRVIWNPAVVDGVGPDYVKPQMTGPMTFGYLGRINVEKGVGTLLEACKLLPAGQWRLVIAGKEPTDNSLMRGLADSMPVEFLGFVPPQDLFAKIDVLVVPSIWAEPLPRTILEAYALGVPAIGARSGGIPDLIGYDNSEWLFEPGDQRALATVMSRVIAAGRNRLPAMGSFADVLAQTTPSVVVQRYGQLYARVRAESRGMA